MKRPPNQEALGNHAPMKGEKMKEHYCMDLEKIGRIYFSAEPDCVERACREASDNLAKRYGLRNRSARFEPFSFAIPMEEEDFRKHATVCDSLPAEFNRRQFNGEGYTGWTFDWPEIAGEEEKKNKEMKKKKTDASAGLSYS
jgi:hypothetical protein